VKLQTQEVVDGQIRENALVKAATYALENTAVTLTYMLLPPLLKPVLYPLIRRFPPQRLRNLNVARMQLFTAALTLAKNTMGRLGLPWKDEVNMVANFGEAPAQTPAQAILSCTAASRPNPASLRSFARHRWYSAVVISIHSQSCLLTACPLPRCAPAAGTKLCIQTV
jgi:hypothetical protein